MDLLAFNAKLSNLLINSIGCDYDIAVLSETWLKLTVNDVEIYARIFRSSEGMGWLKSSVNDAKIFCLNFLILRRHRMYKELCGGALHSHVLGVRNNCLAVGYYPLEWKNSFIIPLHKSDSRDITNNYPSTTSVPLKLFEGLLSARSMWSPCQQGFFFKAHQHLLTCGSLHVIFLRASPFFISFPTNMNYIESKQTSNLGVIAKKRQSWLRRISINFQDLELGIVLRLKESPETQINELYRNLLNFRAHFFSACLCFWSWQRPLTFDKRSMPALKIMALSIDSSIYVAEILDREFLSY